MSGGKLHLSGWFDDFDTQRQCEENSGCDRWEWMRQLEREAEADIEWEEACTDYGGEG